MNQQKNHNIVLLDFCSEKNRGDAAMQIGLINLVKKYYPHGNISIVSVFGANQIQNLRSEYDHSSKTSIPILGGLKPTFYPLGENEEKPEIRTELLNAIFFVVAVLLLLLLALKIPASWLVRILPSEFRTTLMAIDKADIVLWNGRNFRSRKNQVLEIYRTFHVIFHSLVCLTLSKPIACIGASVWELNSPVSRRLLKYAFDRCFFISLREQNSYNAAKALLGRTAENRIRLLPDLSFAAFSQRDTIIQARKPSDNAALPQKVGITLVDWHTDGENIRQAYKVALKEVIHYFLKQNSQVVIIPQVTKKWENVDELLGDLETTLNPAERELVTVVQGEPGVDELLAIYSQLDFLIATRMHSAIFASAVETPLVAIAYDSGGKWSILEGLGYGDFILPYSKITSVELLDRISSCWNDRSVLLETVKQNVSKNIQLVDLNVSIISGFLEGKSLDGKSSNAP